MEGKSLDQEKTIVLIKYLAYHGWSLERLKRDLAKTLSNFHALEEINRLIEETCQGKYDEKDEEIEEIKEGGDNLFDS